VSNGASWGGGVGDAMDRPQFLESGEQARLIPVAADSSREARAASILMAALSAVPSFAQAMLGPLGQRLGKRARLDCFTEVVLADGRGEAAKVRPDGLMVLDGGRGREWRCLVEAKIGRAQVDPEQLTTYLALARRCGIDGVLTVSNQFVALPTHSPVKIAKSASRGVQTYHWSWISVLTNAELLLGEDSFEHPEQRYILSEVVRYFAHPSVSVATFDRMNSEWKELNAKVQAGARLAKSAPEVEASVAAWHQECRDLCLLMSRTLNRPVRQRLSRAHAEDPFARVKDESEQLVSRHELRSALEVPDAAAPLVVTADLQRRSLSVSASLAAPQDKQRASSRINWVLRQLAKSDPADIHVRAHWPGRAPDTQAPLTPLRENPSLLEAENRTMVPTQFDVLLISDIAGRFAGSKTFIELLEDVVPRFYEQVGQHLRAYVAPPPKPRPAAQENSGGEAEPLMPAPVEPVPSAQAGVA
jgi:hypothetical protein